MIGRIAPKPVNTRDPASCKNGTTLVCRLVAILFSTGITCSRIGSAHAGSGNFARFPPLIKPGNRLERLMACPATAGTS